MDTAVTPSRPRVEGTREREILGVALDLVVESGYDRLTLDAVAARSHASKATLYRRWASKAELIADAVCAAEGEMAATPDTGSLRGDLLAMATAKAGAFDRAQIGLLCSLTTAMFRDEDLGAAFRNRFLGPRQGCVLELFERARDRGEIGPHVDLALLGSVLPAVLLFHLCVIGVTEPLDVLAVKVIDQVVLPALTAPPPAAVPGTG